MALSGFRRIVCGTLVVCALSAGLGSLSACSSQSLPDEPSGIEPYVSPYDFSGLTQENGRFTYSEHGAVQSKIGIDVSEHQGIIDWDAVARDGIEFAFIRLGNRGATQGALSLDEHYQANLQGAQAAQIPVGIYFFSQAITADEAIEEAQFVLDNLQGAALQYPIVYDHEPVTGIENARANNLSRAQATENAQAFCQRIEEAGYRFMIYGNKSDIARLDQSLLDTTDIWFAEYGTAVPSGRFDFSLWQFTNNATVAGVPTRVDLNIEFLTAPSKRSTE